MTRHTITRTGINSFKCQQCNWTGERKGAVEYHYDGDRDAIHVMPEQQDPPEFVAWARGSLLYQVFRDEAA